MTIPTDGALGLTKAIEAMWSQALRIRDWFHQRQNLQQKIPALAWPEFKALVVDLRDAPPREKAEGRRDAVMERYQREFPEACRWGKKRFSVFEPQQMPQLTREAQAERTPGKYRRAHNRTAS